MTDHDYLTFEEIRQEELKILDAFDRFCREHSLSYSLAYGSLLGAARHNGFIPWDDDIDVLMPRPDYERMLSIDEPISQTMDLHFANARATASDKVPYPSTYTKLVNRKIATFEANVIIDLNQYLFIDIFPLDGTDGLNRHSKFLKDYWNKALLLGSCLTRSSSLAKELVKKCLRPFAGNPFNLAQKLDQNLQGLDWASSQMVSDIASSTPAWFYQLPKTEFLQTVELDFEGRKFPAMSCWQQALETWYGVDFMKLPPENERVSHQMKAWRLA